MISPIGNDEMIVIFFYYKAFLFHKKCLQTIKKKTFFFVVFDLDLGIAQTANQPVSFVLGFLFFAINLISLLFFCRFQLVDIRTTWNSVDQPVSFSFLFLRCWGVLFFVINLISLLFFCRFRLVNMFGRLGIARTNQ